MITGVRVVQAPAAVAEAPVGAHRLGEADCGAALHRGEVDGDDAARMRENVERAAEAVHGGQHRVGLDPRPIQLTRGPLPGLRGERLDVRAAGPPPGEAYDLVVRRRGGVEGEDREPGPALGPGEGPPPPRDRIRDVERRRVGRVEEEEAVAAVDQCRTAKEREEIEVALLEPSVIGSKCVPIEYKILKTSCSGEFSLKKLDVFIYKHCSLTA